MERTSQTGRISCGIWALNQGFMNGSYGEEGRALNPLKSYVNCYEMSCMVGKSIPLLLGIRPPSPSDLSSSWKTLLALLSCPQSSARECPLFLPAVRSLQSSSSVAFALHLRHRNPWLVWVVLCLEESDFPP